MRPLRRVLLLRLTLLGAGLGLAACGGGPAALRNTSRPDIAADAAQPPREDKAMYLDLIGKMQQQGAYYASLAHVQAFRQRFGNPPELRLLEADALRETGQSAAAATAYHGLLGGAQAAAARHGLGLLAAAAGDAGAAEQELRKATELDPVNVAYLGDLGFALLRAGDLANAREPLAKAAELAPDNQKAVSNLALWTLLSGDPQRADAMMQRAELPAASREAIVRLAVQWRERAASVPAPIVPNSPQTGAKPVPPTQVASATPAATKRINADNPVSVKAVKPSTSSSPITLSSNADAASQAAAIARGAVARQGAGPSPLTVIPGGMLDRFATTQTQVEVQP